MSPSRSRSIGFAVRVRARGLAVPAAGGKPDVFLDRQPVEDIGHLRLDADAKAGDLVAFPPSCPGRGPDLARGGHNCPVRHLKKVDLPAPFGPIRQRSSLSNRVKST
jgi:hypothetical protein